MNNKGKKNPIIRLFNVSKRYGAKLALNNVSLDIEPGEFIFVSGPSGAGKSTLLRVLYLAENVSEGQILIDGMNLARISSRKLPVLRRRFGMVFQDFKLIPSRTVFENVALVLEVAGEKPSYIRKKVMHVLRTTGMEKKINALPQTLSGGEQQRVAVARAVVGEPSIILADEPTGSLDDKAAQAVMDFLMEYHKKGATILVASHNLHLMETTVRGRNIVLEEGKLKTTSTMLSNRFMNFITIITISLSILIVSVFMLFFENASRVIEVWNQGGRAMIYLESKFSRDMLPGLEAKIHGLGGIDGMVFIPKSQALDKLKKEMGSRTEFFKTLKTNPLPDAIEIKMKTHGSFEQIQEFARQIEALDMVENVEYGQGWLGKFLNIFNLFKMTGYAMCGLFLFIALFITANTVRLAFYSRRLEVEIMRLVGATEGFIKTPFYVEGLFQGFIGGVLGLVILLAGYLTISSGIAENLASYVYTDIRFLSVKAILIILFSSTFLGWFGCYLSLKQILK